MSDTLRLDVVTPDGVAFCEDAQMVTLPAIEGQIGIYPQHVRLITRMVPGELIVTKDGRDTVLVVGEGLVSVTGERIDILTDMAIRAEEIDDAKVAEARQRAAARREERISDESVATLNAALVHALSQLQVRRRRPS
jgi:F-type H+-transporting ATPase subunit epsilon